MFVVRRDTSELKAEVFTPSIKSSNISATVKTTPNFETFGREVFKFDRESQTKVMNKEGPGETGHNKVLVKKEFAETIDTGGLNFFHVVKKPLSYFTFNFIFLEINTDVTP